MENEQTAVSYLIENFRLYESKSPWVKEILYNAQMIEKKQIMKAYRTGMTDYIYNGPLPSGEDYYKENYEQQKKVDNDGVRPEPPTEKLD